MSSQNTKYCPVCRNTFEQGQTTTTLRVLLESHDQEVPFTGPGEKLHLACSTWAWSHDHGHIRTLTDLAATASPTHAHTSA